MKTSLTILAAVALISFSACSDDKKSANVTSAPAANSAATAAPAGQVALNPEHGQPGHRCDIEVGAPLDLPQQPRLNAPQPAFQPPVSSQVAPGTNPPHGQPGHDCAIPVGAPLPK